MSDDDETLGSSFSSAVSEFFDSRETKTDYQTKLDNISSWVDDQKKKGKEDEIKEIGEALQTTINALQKFSTGDPYDITCGTLDIIASVASVTPLPYGPVVAAFCGIVGAIVSANKPGSPGVVAQLAGVVHSELVDFNSKLQDQDLSGLQNRVQRQISQLQEMAPEEKLFEPGLWNDFNDFMGKLLPRVKAPLPYKYEKNLTKDAPEMADFVKALKTYCTAYTCFIALLTMAKVKFEEFGRTEELKNINGLLKHQKETAKEAMRFLSEEKHLTFLGRLPSEGGSLTKILLLTRDPYAKDLIEATRSKLDLPAMPESEEVKEKAEKVFRQSVRLKYDSMQVPENLLCVQFFNETDFPMRVVSGTVGWPKGNLEFTKDIDPRSFHQHTIESFTGSFSIGGYMKIAYNGKLSPKEDANERGTGIIEFAMSRPFYNPWGDSGNNYIQDKSDTGRTQGEETHKNMSSGEDRIIYWKRGEKHYLAKCENRKNLEDKMKLIKMAKTWRFIVQEFDPLKDVVNESFPSWLQRKAYDAVVQQLGS